MVHINLNKFNNYSEDLILKVFNLRSEGKHFREIGELVGLYEKKTQNLL